MSNGWSDRKSWWMDLLKSSIAFLLGIFITLYFLDDISETKQQNSFKWQTDYSIYLNVNRDFEKNARVFANNSVAALRSKMFKEQSEVMKTKIVQWDDSFDIFSNSIESMKFWYKLLTNKDLSIHLSITQKLADSLRHLDLKLPLISNPGTGNAAIYIEKLWMKERKENINPVISSFNESINEMLRFSRDDFKHN